MVDLTIVIPVYNSLGTLPRLLESLNESFRKHQNFKVVFVDDGSIQPCYLFIQNYAKVFPFETYQLNKNYGQHAATSYGLSKVETEFAGTMDDDLQQSPEDLIEMFYHLRSSDYDLVYGKFAEKKHNLFRNLASKLIKGLFRIENLNFSIVTSMRVFRKSLSNLFVQSALQVQFIDYLLLHSTERISYFELNHKERLDRSSYTFKKLVSLAWNLLFLHSAIPLKWITRLGLLFSIMSMFFGIYFIIMKVKYGAPLGYTSLIVAIFFSSGLIITFLGVIAEFIRRIWVAGNYTSSIVVRKSEKG